MMQHYEDDFIADESVAMYEMFLCAHLAVFEHSESFTTEAYMQFCAEVAYGRDWADPHESLTAEDHERVLEAIGFQREGAVWTAPERIRQEVAFAMRETDSWSEALELYKRNTHDSAIGDFNRFAVACNLSKVA